MKHFTRLFALLVLALATGCVSVVPSGFLAGSPGASSSPASPSTSPAPHKLGAPILTWGGDLAGSTMQSQTVAALHGVTLPTPTGTGTVLTYNGSALSWGAGGGFSAGGDLSGTSTSQTVTQAQSGAVTFTSGTTPVIQSSSTATSLAVGTNRPGATLALRADAASTVATLAATSIAFGPPVISLSNGTSASGDGANVTWTTQAPGGAANVGGDLVVNTPPSAGGGSKYGGFQVAYNTTTMIDMGSYSNGNNAGIWIKAAPSTTNFSFLGDGSITVLNAPNGSTGVIYLRIGNNTRASVSNTLFSSTVPVALGATTGANTYTGSAAYTTRTVTASFTVDTPTTDHTIGIDTTAGVVTVTLPTPTTGRHLHLVNVAGSWATHNPVLARHSTEKINAASGNKTLTGTNGVTTIYECDIDSLDGVDWYTSCN